MLDALRRHFGFSDAKLAELAGYKGHQIELRRKGMAAIDVDDMHRISAALSVPPSIFLDTPAAAIRYVLDNDITIDGPTNNYGNRWRPTLIEGGSDQQKRQSNRTLWPQRQVA